MKSMGSMSGNTDHGPIDKTDPEPENNIETDENGKVDWYEELKKRVDEPKSRILTECEGVVESYDGLVSIEAAPIIVGRQKYDIDLVSECRSSSGPSRIEVANIAYEMRSLDIEVSVEEVQDEFSKQGADWRVVNVVVEDTSGSTQIPFWNEDADKVKHLNGGYEEKLVIEGAYTKSEDDVRDYHKSRHDAPPIELGDSTTVKVVYPDGEEETLID